MPSRMNFERELNAISDNLVLMCRHIESAIEKSVKVLVKRDFELANEIYEEDKLIDKLEREIENACLKLLMMEHPVAGDFRQVSATLKMITDLERMGDQTWDIAEIMTQFGDSEVLLHNTAPQAPDFFPVPVTQMATIVIQMVKDSVQAYINRDIELARSIDITDDKVDELFSTVTANLIAWVKNNPKDVEQAFMLMMIAKYLERIGDHAVNVAEWVEYAITGNHPKKAHPSEAGAAEQQVAEPMSGTNEKEH